MAALPSNMTQYYIRSITYIRFNVPSGIYRKRGYKKADFHSRKSDFDNLASG